MSVNKNNLPSEGSPKSVTSLLNFASNTLSNAYAYKHGVVTVIEFALSDASTHFLKFGSNGQLEIGGTLELGSGTAVKW